MYFVSIAGGTDDDCGCDVFHYFLDTILCDHISYTSPTTELSAGFELPVHHAINPLVWILKLMY